MLARDAALHRVSRTRRWMIVGATALTAGFAALVSAVAPGRSLASKSAASTEASTAARSSSAVPQLPPAASPDSLGLQGPSQAPQPVPAAPQNAAPPPQPSGGGGVVSGGS